MMEIPLVNGSVMVGAFQQLEREEETKSVNHLEIVERIEELKEHQEFYRVGGFRAQSERIGRQIRDLKNIINMSEFEAKLTEYRDLGKWVINIPEWDGEKVIQLDENHDAVVVPYKIVKSSAKKDFANFNDLQALFSVPIANFSGEVPLWVAKKCGQLREEGKTNLHVMFVARLSKIRDLIKSFPKQDPAIVEMLGNDIGVIHTVWGDDHEEIDLVLAMNNRGDVSEYL
jgi:hypothetical protein